MIPIETDAVIVGAGPIGLFQVFELGLQEIRSHVLDCLPQIGGQCTQLYPDKPIYDIPAIPVCSAGELIANLSKQIEPFAPVFHLSEQVNELTVATDGRFILTTSSGKIFLSKTIFIAAGVGAFQARKLKLESVVSTENIEEIDDFESFEDKQVFYNIKDPKRFIGRNLVIVGGGDSAIDWALYFVKTAASITLIHRRDQFRAAPNSAAKLNELCASGKIKFLVGQITAFHAQAKVLRTILFADNFGSIQEISLDDLLVFFGLSPRLGPIANWGISLEKRQLPVDTEKFETNIKGIFAVGDINTYPGKKKLILSGFHEAALAAFAAAQYISPEKKIHLQYTTTSSKLHKVLGV